MLHNSLSVIILFYHVALPTYRHFTYPAFRTAKLSSFADVSVTFLSMPETPLCAPYTGVHIKNMERICILWQLHCIVFVVVKQE